MILFEKIKQYFREVFTVKGAQEKDERKELQKKTKWENKYKAKYLKKHGKYPSKKEIESHIIKKEGFFLIIVLLGSVISLVYKIFDLFS